MNSYNRNIINIVLASLLLLTTFGLVESSSPLIIMTNEISKNEKLNSPFVSKSQFIDSVINPLGCNDVSIIYTADDLEYYKSSEFIQQNRLLNKLSSFKPDVSVLPVVENGLSVSEIANGFVNVCSKLNVKSTIINNGQHSLSNGSGSLVFIINKNTDLDLMNQINSLVNNNWAVIIVNTNSKNEIAARSSSFEIKQSSEEDDDNESKNNKTHSIVGIPWSERSLLHKYVFFSNGILMAYTVLVPILLVSFIGVYLLSTLSTPRQIIDRNKTHSKN